MTNKNAAVIYVQLDTSQVEDSVSRVAAVLEDLESTVNRLGENISSAFSGLLQIPNTISSIESVGAVIKPIYILKLQDEYKLHPALYVRDPFSAEEKLYGKLVNEDALATLIKSYDSGDYGLFNGDLGKLDHAALLEQYKLFLQTSEDLVNRRQNVNSFYISISSALAAFMGVLVTMDFDKRTELMIGFVFA